MGRMSAELRLPLCEPGPTAQAAVQQALAQLGLVGPYGLARSAARVVSLCL
jgi:hypothetical protein